MALSYPQVSTSQSEASTSMTASTSSLSQAGKRKPQSTRCLHLSNLEASADEYLLLRLFRPHGKITKLDFVRHKSGPQRGRPRGFAFVEYETAQEALSAMQAMSERVIRGKPLRINFANISDNDGARRPKEEVNKPTALSMLKSKSQPASTNGKIKALEAKLRKIEQAAAQDSQSAMDSASQSQSVAAAPSSLSSEDQRRAKNGKFR